MIPQSSPLVTSLKGLLGVQQIYVTKPSEFPYGWRLASVPLRGEKYADASPVFYKGRWYVWITAIANTKADMTYELRLYIVNGPRLATDPWVLHPRSPITHDMRYARMGGRPTIFNGELYRPAQVELIVKILCVHLTVGDFSLCCYIGLLRWVWSWNTLDARRRTIT
jgi:hypothetical protein